MGKNKCKVCRFKWPSIKAKPLRCARCGSTEWRTGKTERKTYEHECAVCETKWNSLKENPNVCRRCHRSDWRSGSLSKHFRERQVDEIKKILALRKGEELKITPWDLIDLIVGALGCSKNTAKDYVTVFKERGLVRRAIIYGGPGWLITLDGKKNADEPKIQKCVVCDKPSLTLDKDGWCSKCAAERKLKEAESKKKFGAPGERKVRAESLEEMFREG